MKLEDYENWDKKKLRQIINACFEHAPEADPVDRLAVLLEAQFYTRELERRSDSWISRRDLFLEIVVILLIGWEVFMGYQQDRIQNQTAQTMAAMNTALQQQLTLFYEISVTPLWDESTKKVTVVNNGRTNITLWGSKFDDEPVAIEDSRMIAPLGTYIIHAEILYNKVLSKVPKGSNQLIPLDLYFKNERGEEFAQHCYIGTSWKGGTLALGLQVVSLEPTRW
jgi:hypothetical protein